MAWEDLVKLNGIEPLANVTDAVNVAAAGAVMKSDTTTAAMGFVIDEDTMVTDSETLIPTQQSVKAYVDSSVAGAIEGGLYYQGAYDASTAPPTGALVLSGFMYTVTVAGDGAGFFAVPLQIGDAIVAEIDNPQVDADWTQVNKNIPDIVAASATAQGIIKLATQTEVNAGTDTVKAITPVTLRNSDVTRKHSEVIGDGVLVSIPVTHNLNEQFVTAQLFDATTNEQIGCEVVLTNATTTTFNFNVAPTADKYRAVIVG
jgi:hypothetical protein